MKKPKTYKRASADPSELQGIRPSALFTPVPDEVTARIGAVVVEYAELEHAMIDVFRVILGIESGEAAALVYSEIRAPSARWAVVRQVLQNDHGHIKTSTNYDEIIDEFLEITGARNKFVHGRWALDADGVVWLSSTQGTVVQSLKPRRVGKNELNELIGRMDVLRRRITEVSFEDRLSLDKRWTKRP